MAVCVWVAVFVAVCVIVAVRVIVGVNVRDGVGVDVSVGVTDRVTVGLGATSEGVGNGNSLTGRITTSAAFTDNGGGATGTLKIPGVGVSTDRLIAPSGRIAASSGSRIRHASSATPPPAQTTPSSRTTIPVIIAPRFAC